MFFQRQQELGNELKKLLKSSAQSLMPKKAGKITAGVRELIYAKAKFDSSK